MSPRSFAASETHFELERSDTPISVDGFKIGEPTGQVICEECNARHLNVDEIPHDADCSQRWVRSEWWVQQMLRD